MHTKGLSRRAFIGTSAAAALATRLFAAPDGSTKPDPELETLGAAALREAKKLKASYADIRIIRYRQQFLTVRLEPRARHGQNVWKCRWCPTADRSASACASSSMAHGDSPRRPWSPRKRLPA